MTQRMNLETFAGWVPRPEPGRRLFVAITGAPGSGKSTVAEALVERLNRGEPGSAALLPMDGYHYDDGLLTALGRLARKGAPDTFDVGGLRHMLLRLRDNSEGPIAVPVFDRDIEVARAGARLIPETVRVIVVEGNYLLLNQPPWAGLAPLFDVTVMLDCSAGVLRERLVRRWRGAGLPAEEIRRRVEENDLPNGVTVAENSIEADIVIAN